MKAKKIFLSVCLSLAVLLSSSYVVSANSYEVKESFVSLDEISKYEDKMFMDSAPNEIVITDPIVIRKLAKEQGFPNVKDIKKLTYKFSKVKQNELNDNEPNDNETNLLSKLTTARTFISDVVDQGTGYKLVDHFDENRYEGPIKGTYTYSRTDTSSYNATVSLNADIVSAGVGFTIGRNYTKSDSVTVNVPAGKKVILKIWTNYQKKSFTIYTEYSSSIGLWYPKGTGNAYKPVGLIFTQAEY
ncbi:hypothetical protein [Peptoanaerobacter stomatis]|uniref:hypothetical protein n=1 Tax=Peptoanaerobacter stomatis TaxID=796937 RepID=UPI003FA096BC